MIPVKTAFMVLGLFTALIGIEVSQVELIFPLKLGGCRI